jgi:hypothetical protein
LGEYSNKRGADFNDYLFYTVIKREGWVCITHDADFKVFSDIPILTKNQRMLPP